MGSGSPPCQRWAAGSRIFSSRLMCFSRPARNSAYAVRSTAPPSVMARWRSPSSRVWSPANKVVSGPDIGDASSTPRRHRRGGMGAIGAHGHRDTLLLKQVIDFELHQHVVPQTRALHPVGGEGLLGAMSQGRKCLFGQRSPDLSYVLLSLLFLTLAAILRVDSQVRLPFGLLGFRMPFPRRQRLREKVFCPPERLDGEVHHFHGLQGVSCTGALPVYARVNSATFSSIACNKCFKQNFCMVSGVCSAMNRSIKRCFSGRRRLKSFCTSVRADCQG